MPKKPTTTPNDILKDHTTNIKNLVNALRKTILDSVPDITEKALPGWHAIGFRHDTYGHFCAVFPFEKTVKLYFEHGAKLDDTNHILQGNTKQTRYIEFTSISDIQKKKIQSLVKQAVLFLTNKK